MHELDCGRQYGRECTCGIGGAVPRDPQSTASPLIDPSAVIHPSARIGRGVRIGVGVVIAEGVLIEDGVAIWHHANILPNAHIKRDAMVAFACQIERGVVVGAYSRIQPFAAPGSGTVIGNDVYFGPYSCVANSPYPPGKRLAGGVVGDGAVIGMAVYIFPGVRIGSRAVVGSGSLVTHDIPPEEVWYGRPVAYVCDRSAYDEKQAAWERGDSELDTRPRHRRSSVVMPGQPPEEPHW